MPPSTRIPFHRLLRHLLLSSSAHRWQIKPDPDGVEVARIRAALKPYNYARSVLSSMGLSVMAPEQMLSSAVASAVPAEVAFVAAAAPNVAEGTAPEAIDAPVAAEEAAREAAEPAATDPNMDHGAPDEEQQGRADLPAP